MAIKMFNVHETEKVLLCDIAIQLNGTDLWFRRNGLSILKAGKDDKPYILPRKLADYQKLDDKGKAVGKLIIKGEAGGFCTENGESDLLEESRLAKNVLATWEAIKKAKTSSKCAY